MDKKIEMLKGMIEDEKAELAKIMEEFVPLKEKKEILEKTIMRYEEILALKTSKTPQDIHLTAKADVKVTTHPVTVEIKGSQSDFVRSLIENDIKSDTWFNIHWLQKLADKKAPGMKLSRIVLHKVLKEKTENKEIKQIEKGKGRTPSKYLKINKSDKYSDS
jgi:hypothetical protein